MRLTQSLKRSSKPLAHPPREGERGSMLRVLVVDDDQDVRDAIVEVLTELGCNVSPAFDGQDAVEQLAAGRFDLVVTDFNMPRLDGIGVARFASTLNVRPFVVVLSGTNDRKAIASAQGVNRVYLKPVDMAMLIKVVQAVEQQLAELASTQMTG